MHHTIPHKLEKLENLTIEANAIGSQIIGYCDKARQFLVNSLDEYENAMEEIQEEAAEAVD